MFAIRHVGQDGGVFARDTDLVVKAIGDPASNFVGRTTTRVHPHVERMVDVITAAFVAQLRFEFLRRPGRQSFGRSGVLSYFHGESKRNVHAIERNFDAVSGQQGTLLGVFDQHGVGVVDVDQDLANTLGQLVELFDHAARAALRQMAHV
jgi:hypothetical protein